MFKACQKNMYKGLTDTFRRLKYNLSCAEWFVIGFAVWAKASGDFSEVLRKLFENFLGQSAG